MKKILLLSAVATLSMSANAQWVRPTLPVPETTTLDLTDTENVETATAYYLYNVDGQAFYGHANNWNTRASLVVAPQDYFCGEHNKTVTAEPMMIKLVKDVETEGYGIMWVKADGNTDYTSPDGWDGIWVDGKRTNYNELTITPTTGNNFTISCSAVLENAVLGCLSTDPSSMQKLNLYVPSEVSGAQLYSTWALVTAEAYEAVRSEEAVAEYQEKVKVYNAAADLKSALDAAKEEYPSLDFSKPEAVYGNTAATVEELQEATRQITIIVNNYKSGLATFENPADLTDQIGDGSDVGPWSREFTGEGQVGTWHTNTWSTEANDGADGTNMTTPFCEDWVANGSLLSDQKIFKVIKDAAPGLYVFDANVRLYNEKGDQEALTGCTMYFGDDMVDISSQVEMYKKNGKCVLWKDGGFRLVTVLEETGDIEVGFVIKDATFNWLAFKDTKLMYYGSEDANKHAVDFYKEGYAYEKIEEEAYAMPSLVEAYNNAVAAYDAAANLADVREAIKSVTTTKDEVEANHKAYENLLAKIEEWQNNASTQSLNGSDWDEFVDYMGGNTIDGYPTPNPTAIAGELDRSLNTEEIASYISTIDEKYSYAVAHSLIEGSDCTAMLVNPKFEDANGTGWSWNANDNVTGLAKRGGNSEFYCAEAYGGWDSNAGFLFDVYQDVNDVPDGIYQISANCFYRWADNGQFDGSEIIPAVIYMNDFESPVQHIASNAVEEVMQEGGTTLLDGWYGTWAKTEGIGYVPNNMDAASCAFSKDMYKQTVYGLVEGGKMRIGIKKETKTTENRHWCLWTNFKLTFMDKNDEAVSSIIKDLSASLSSLLDSDVAEDADADVVSKGVDLVADAAAANKLSAEERYQLMKDINQCIKDIKTSSATAKEIAEQLQQLYDAVNDAYDYEEYEADANYQKIVDDIAEWQNDMYTKYEDQSLTAEEKASIAGTVTEYIARLGIKGDWTKATEEAPVDMTPVIVNADFSTGNANGWTDTFTSGNHGYQSNAEYGDVTYEEAFCSKFVEAWKSGSAALDNGSISQTIGKLGYNFLAELPAGNYILKADINAQNQGDASINGGVFLYAANGENIYQTEISSTNTEEGTVVKTNEVMFTISEENRTIEIGVKTVNTGYNWFTADNFKLLYLGAGEPIEPNAITDVVMANGKNAIYNLNGQMVSKAVKGIYIVNGKKVVVK